jgi:hypothetical protein
VARNPAIISAWYVCAMLLIAVIAGTSVLQACGDKFLVVGRGLRFQNAYAAIHPASLLLVLPLKSVKSAAVRDSRLLTALKMAGHRVDTAQQPANLTEMIGRAHYDIVVAERTDAAAIPQVEVSGRPKASVVAVLEGPSMTELAAAQHQFDFVLNTPQPLSKILNLLDDIMKARLAQFGRSAPSGT